MRPFRRLASGWVLVAALAVQVGSAGCTGSGSSSGAVRPAPRAPEVLWDTWGVPHIFAASDEDLFFAHGWAQAAAHGDLLLRLYGQAR
ncbi:MAG TPA: penicillin acylase family protein, partial [Thermoanaerobaculia bacterium]|nr:penicillin acylase family protein [Thermoanaerobaculia bacterium]